MPFSFCDVEHNLRTVLVIHHRDQSDSNDVQWLCADKSNGVQKVWLDQKLVTSWNNLRYSIDSNKHQIERMVWQNFHGGKDQRFAPDMDQTQQYVSALLSLDVSCLR